MFKNLFKKKINVIFHMRSGNAIKFRCTDFTVNPGEGGKLTAYNIKGFDTRARDQLFWCDVTAIESVEVIR
jgi:hypothetical protein